MRNKILIFLLAALLFLAPATRADWYFNFMTGTLDYYEIVGSSDLGDLNDVTFAALARGAIIYRGVAVWQNLPAGAAGQVLTMGANDPLWAAAGAPGAHAASHEVGGADLVDHDQLTNYLAAQHLTLPNTIVAVLTDHNLAAHTNAIGGTGVDSSGWSDYIYVTAGVWAVDPTLGHNASGLDITANADTANIILDGANLNIRWSDGNFIAQTDEGANTESLFQVIGKGTGAGQIYAYDTDADTYIGFSWPGGDDAPNLTANADLDILWAANNDVNFFRGALSGENPTVGIHGYVTAGAAVRTGTLQIDEGNDEFVIGAENNANLEGVTIDLPEAAQSFRIRGNAGLAFVVDNSGAVTTGTWNGTDIGVADGGTGRSTSTTAYGLLAAGTTATNPHQTLAAGLTTQILVGGGAAALPAWGIDIPTAVTIGGQYNYRAGGTDVAVADGGTGLGAWVVGDIVYASGVGTLAGLADVAVNSVLASGGVGVAPAYTTNPTVTTLNAINTIDVNSNGTTGEDGVDFNSINTTFSTIAQSDAEGIAGDSDLRIGLDESLRNMIICDVGDIGTDFALAVSGNPALYIYNAAANQHILFTYQFFYAANSPYDFQALGRMNFTGGQWADVSAGDLFTFRSGGGSEFTDTNAEQAWVSIEDKYDQADTAAGGSILVKSLLTGVGDASSGKGYNFFADFRVDDTNDTSLYNIARMHVTKIHSSDLFDAAGLTDSVTIWTQPANSRLENVVIVLEAQFVAAGLTDLDVTVGDAGDNTGILLETMNLTSDAVGLDYSLKGAYWSATTAGAYYTTAAKAWLAYSTAVGANLNTTSAGEVIFYFIYTQY